MMQKSIVFFLIALVFLGINSCRPSDNSYYNINKLKAVVAVFQNSDLITNGIASQQFPLRLTTSTTPCTNTKFYLLATSPTAEIPSLTINSIVVFPIGNNYLSNGGGARGVSAGTKGPSVDPTFFFTSATPTVTFLQTTPFRLTVFEFSVNCALNLTESKLNSFIAQVKDIPGFQMSYTVSSNSSSETGFYSFYFLPEPDAAWWNSASTLAGMTASLDKITQIKNGLAVTNNPVQITNITPTSNSTVAGEGEVSINANIINPAPPAQRASNSLFKSKTRVQWYVTSGTINLDTASSTTWNPSVGSGNTVGGFVVVRDLLGGIDFKILGPLTTK